MENKTSESVVIYARVSQDKKLGGVEGLAVERQLKECRAWAEERGFTVEAEYIDNSVSATTKKPREGFEQMLKDRPKNILVWNHDRLMRTISDLGRVLEIGATVYQVTASQFDLVTPQGKMMASVLIGMANYEVEIKAERQLAKNRQLAEQGVYRSTFRPIGNYKDGRLHEKEAEVVRRFVRDYLENRATLYGLAKEFNEQGITTPQGGKWITASVRRFLSRPRLKGYQEYKGTIYKLKDWEPVLTEEEYDLLQAKLELKSTGSPHSHNSREDLAMLTGFLKCDTCGKNLNRSYAEGDHQRPQYKCPQGHIYLSATAIEEIVAFNVVEWLGFKGSSKTDNLARSIREINTEKRRIRAEHERWVSEAIQAGLSPKLIQERENVVSVSLDTLAADGKALMADPFTIIFEGEEAQQEISHETVMSAFNALGREAQRDVISTFIREIVIGKGKRGGHANHASVLLRIKKVELLPGSLGTPYTPDELRAPTEIIAGWIDPALDEVA